LPKSPPVDLVPNNPPLLCFSPFGVSNRWLVWVGGRGLPNRPGVVAANGFLNPKEPFFGSVGGYTILTMNMRDAISNDPNLVGMVTL